MLRLPAKFGGTPNLTGVTPVPPKNPPAATPSSRKRAALCYWWHRPPACCFRRHAGNRLRQTIIFPTTANPQAASPREIWRDAKFNRRDACSTPKPPGGDSVQSQTSGTLFLVAQASGLLFPASRRKPFATTIIFPTTANPQAASPREIWRDAKFNRRDACSTQNHAGGDSVQSQTSGTLFWVAQASGLLFPASRRKPFATKIIFPATANPQAASPREIWRDAKFNRRDACSTQNHAGGDSVQSQTSGTLFLVAQASGLLFPASRRKPFATTIIFPTTVNSQATSPHEIWRDACSTQHHTGCCCVRQCSEPEPSTRSTA